MRRAALALLLAACGASRGFDAVSTMQTVAGGTGLSGDVDVVYDGLGVPHVDSDRPGGHRRLPTGVPADGQRGPERRRRGRVPRLPAALR